MSGPPILISAGEASSDMYAARIASILRDRTGAKLFGMGGPRMREAGVDLIADYHEVAVVGISEVLHKLPSVYSVQKRLARAAAERGARLAILVDSPGTHLGVARRLKKHGIPVGYFIGPQVWAWRAGRVRVVKRLVKKMVVIFPFEEKIYRDAGVPVEYVGHPLVDVVHPSITRAEFAAQYGLDPEQPIVTLLPGSRRNEIAQHFGTILDACEVLSKNMAITGGVQFVHVAAPGLGEDLLAQYARPNLRLTRTEGGAYEALAAADCAVVASGTATVEAALLGAPMVVIYRVTRTTAAILRHMIRTPYIAMVNLIAGKAVVPELIQDAFTAAAVEEEVRQLLVAVHAREEMKANLAEVRARLGTGGAIERAAEVFLQML